MHPLYILIHPINLPSLLSLFDPLSIHFKRQGTIRSTLFFKLMIRKIAFKRKIIPHKNFHNQNRIKY